MQNHKEVEAKDITNTEEDDLFRHHRFLDNPTKAIQYAVPIANGDYAVKLFLTEMNWKIKNGDRILDIKAENNVLIPDLDLRATYGLRTAYMPITDEFNVNDGTLNLTVQSKTDVDGSGPTISAFQIMQILAQNGDEDSDGITNINDECIYTPDSFKNTVNAQGCASEELDNDNDGILNPADNCPNTANLSGFPATTEIVDENGCSLSDLDSDADGVDDGLDQCQSTPNNTSVNELGCSTSEAAILSQPFQEQNGLVIVEMEATNYPKTNSSGKKPWKLVKGDFSAGNYYLNYTGGWNSNRDADKGGLITVDINITTPGIYRFLWRSFISHGYLSSEGNDAWLSMASLTESFKFFGYSSKGKNTTLCTPDAIPLDTCIEDGHNESKKGDYFKVFRNGQPTWAWNYATYINGGDTHAMYLEVFTPGVYQVLIQGRSQKYNLDRFVLYRDELYNNTGTVYSEETASDPSLPASTRVPL